MVRPLPPPQLYAITPDWQQLNEPEQAVATVLAAGCRLVQYRDKTASSDQRRQRGQALLALCRRYGARLIINDDWQLARDIGADGAHLGVGDGDWQAARRACPPPFVLGLTCHAEANYVRAAITAGADYVALGACFASGGKRQAPVADTRQLRALSQDAAAQCDVALIGGIDEQNIDALIDLPFRYLAVMSAIFLASPAQNLAKCRALIQRLADCPPRPTPTPV